MSEVTINKTIKQRTFVKYKISIERVEIVPTVRQEWVRVNDQQGPGQYDYGPEYETTSYESTTALEMEIREDIDLRRVVKALLWKDGES